MFVVFLYCKKINLEIFNFFRLSWKKSCYSRGWGRAYHIYCLSFTLFILSPPLSFAIAGSDGHRKLMSSAFSSCLSSGYAVGWRVPFSVVLQNLEPRPASDHSLFKVFLSFFDCFSSLSLAICSILSRHQPTTGHRWILVCHISYFWPKSITIFPMQS